MTALVVELVDTQDLNLNLSAFEETHRVEPFKFGETLSVKADWQSRAKSLIFAGKV